MLQLNAPLRNLQYQSDTNKYISADTSADCGAKFQPMLRLLTGSQQSPEKTTHKTAVNYYICSTKDISYCLKMYP